jgi:hypothetical protein
MSLTVLIAGVCMLRLAAAMIWYEHARNRAGRPLRQREAVAIPYWIAYLSMLPIGSVLALAALVR